MSIELHPWILQDQNGIGPLVDSVTLLPIHLIVLLQGDVRLVLFAKENPEVAGGGVAHGEGGRVAGHPDPPLLPVGLAPRGPSVRSNQEVSQDTKDDLQNHLVTSTLPTTALDVDVFNELSGHSAQPHHAHMTSA